MMKSISIYIIVFFCIVGSVPMLDAQINPQERREELNRKGISEEEIKIKLLERGIDVENINVNDPNELLEIENQINEVIIELEREKQSLNIESKNQEKKVTIDTLKEENLNLTESDIKSTEIEQSPEQIVELPGIYGHHIFKNKSLALYKKSDNIKPSDAYILGVGDDIGISIWGYSQESQTYEIDDKGYITPYKMEPIYLAGLSYGESKELLEKRFNQYYRFKSNEFKATLKGARNINVNIYGEVESPGTYSISSNNSAFNALVAAGGPTSLGTVRKIKLIKPGKAPKNIDVYKFLNNPGINENFYLEENDIIHIPVADRIVNVEGAVIREAKYELSDGEDLVELFELCGGFKANAVLQNILIKRFVNDEEKIFDINFNEYLKTNSDFKLLNGDLITVGEITQTFNNYVKIVGAVNNPGTYAINNNTYLKEVLSKVNVLPSALIDIAYIKRYNPDNKSAKYEFFNVEEVLSGSAKQKILLQPRDEITINKQSKFADNQVFSVSGAIREPGEYQVDGSGSINFDKATFLAGGLRIDATDFAYIKRKKFIGSNQLEYIRVNLEEGKSTGEILIENGDEIVIYSSLSDSDQVFVSIEGAVKKPGKFIYDSSLTLRDVLSMSGGFKISAAPYKVDVYRLTFDDKKKSRVLAAHLSLNEQYQIGNNESFDLNPFDQIFVREAPEFELQKTVKLIGEVKYQGKYPILQDNEKITDVVKRAGGLSEGAFVSGTTLFRNQDSLGYIVIDLKEAIENPKSHFNLNILDGDVITVPKTSNIVTIIGETRAKDLGKGVLTNNGKIHAPYQKGKNADYYIQKYAGGIGENGSKKLITVTFPTGDVKTSNRFLIFKKYPEVRPGSTIRIGNKKIKELKEQKENDTDWGRVLTDSVAQVTAILSLVLLVQRID